MELKLTRKKLCHAILTLLAVPECFGLPSVFLSKSEASRPLEQRVRRANSFLEELKLGDLERECLEEKCSYEEAREIFSVPEQLEDFWKRYSDVDSCQSGPCQSGATCVDQMNTYICICPKNFEGRHCDKETLPPSLSSSYGCLYKNGGCEHFCVEISGSTHHCECAPGYTLSTDKHNCTRQGGFPCGQPLQSEGFSPRIVKGDTCLKGQCPWQALLKYAGEYKCGGVILDSQWILTAAHCVWNMDSTALEVILGEHILNDPEGTEQERNVSEVFIHPQYNHSSTDSDIALLRLGSRFTLDPFALPVCLPPATGSFLRTLGAVRMSTVSGWGRLAQSGPVSPVLQKLDVPRVPLEECRARSGLAVSRNMLCAGFLRGGRDSCQGDSGGPLVTQYRNTWFLTGIVSWGKGCASAGVYGIYTRVSVFLEWINNTMASA
ncbi:coagulation factor VII [Pseudorasbora parva]|uniref:coagulation factor VII n=1 Tax=Pseudorasbora parva TaxID=51549 RepID=UPI00351F0BD8